MNVIKVLTLFAVLSLALFIYSNNLADVDLWGNVGFVKALPWEEGFMYTNTFSFTEPDRPWINHEWLAQYIFHHTHSRFGSAGLLILKVILGFCVTGIIYIAARATCGSGAVRLLWMALVISTMGYGFSTRPHLFTYLLYTCFLYYLWRHQAGARWPSVTFLFLGIFWVNLHGAFFIGIIILGLYIVFEALKKEPRRLGRPAAVLALFTAGAFVNPYGARLWGFLFESAAKARPYLSEWEPFDALTYLKVHPDFVVLAIFTFIAVVFSRRQRDITWLGILSAAFVSALFMRRNIPLFAITAGFVVPGHLEDVCGATFDKMAARLKGPVLAAALAFVIAASAYFTIARHKTAPLEIEVSKGKFAVDAVSYIKANGISGNALVFFNWAEYFIWETYPQCRVFLDGRFCSAYSEKVIDDFFNFLYLDEGWEAALENYDVDILLLHRENPVSRKILLRPEWALVYVDCCSALFVKKARHAELLKRIESGRAEHIHHSHSATPVYF